ncbi:MAG TPA: C25 family cysteine peptidase, partial [Ferruginibacter sp.]|nr:C25 family cysteine peptidase [Ferruginibacter sp.]
MRKALLTLNIVLLVITGYSQLNNSWIDYSKTYYKFKVSRDSMCRISQPVLAAAGLGTVPAQNFQLWRNGKEVRLYTSIPTGVFGAGDYIEFRGEMNDGKPDKDLYRNADYQLNDKYSLSTDTATYFLTVDPAANNLRYTASANPVATNVLPADAYFMRRIETHYRGQTNKGNANTNAGEYLYSSSYDIGEGWTSGDISPSASLFKDLTNMNRYAAGPPNSVMFTVSAAGNASNTRELIARFYNTTILGSPAAINPMPFFSYHRDTVRNLPLSLLASPTNLPVSINGNSSNANDRLVVSSFSVTYPATFNFNNEKNFYFELEANPAGNFIVINNFNNNGIAPILYDITNGLRYLGDIAVPGQVRFALPPSSAVVRKFDLISNDLTNVNTITSLTGKTFTDFSIGANQGDYLIISNPVLYNNGSGVNNVELYRQYRSSIAGGSFNSKIYNIDELNDQFGFGIQKHPSAIRDFIRYAGQQFSPAPQYVFIIGRGLSYIDYAANQANPVTEQIDLVQTFGWPASDILLSATPGTAVPLIPIGRLGAITGSEVGIYLDKMKHYEQVQQSPSQTIADKGWMKNMLHTIGGATSQETLNFTAHMNDYKAIAEDTLYGAHVETFAKTSVSAIEQEQSQRIAELFQEGLGYIKYFGHSSANELAINLNYPENYQNNGKYPFMHVSGCTVGNFFTFSGNRINGYAGMSLSEKYVLLDHKGSIGFLGSTHFGLEDFLDDYNQVYYDFFCRKMYGNTVGNQIKNTLQTLYNNPSLDFLTRMHMEEINLHGDPALKINSFARPDYVIEEQLVKFTPNIITVADNTFTVDIKMMNIGRAIKDSIRVSVKQKLPNDSIKVLYNQLIPAIRNTDSLRFIVTINPLTDKGLNKLIVSLDDDNRVAELSEMNNILTKDFYIFEDELRPVSPYNYSIVTQQNINFYASTANPLSGQRQYVMEIDTTELFNSPFKRVFNVSGTGGVIQFAPNVIFTDSTVYYWRTSTVPLSGNNIIWNNFSFVYLANGATGFNQSHYYQLQKNTYNQIKLGNDRLLRYTTRPIEYNVRTAIYPASNQGPDYSIRNDGILVMEGFYGPGLAPNTEGLRFYVIDTVTKQVWVNQDNGVTGQYGSVRPIPINPTAKPGWFQFKIETEAERNTVRDFLTNIVPDGHYVVLTNCPAGPFTHFAGEWLNDNGASGNSMYHTLKNSGFTYIDSIKTHLPFVYVYKKGTGVAVNQTFGLSFGDKLDVGFHTIGNNLSGDIMSDKLGPAKQWNELHWRGTSLDNPVTDSNAVEIYGITSTGTS